ncbi:MAG: hypothetical protein HY063_11710 [Bacteroidetes bacterium]|nr:hypothetical protein [Bacteroidota bacterium]
MLKVKENLLDSTEEEVYLALIWSKCDQEATDILKKKKNYITNRVKTAIQKYKRPTKSIVACSFMRFNTPQHQVAKWGYDKKIITREQYMEYLLHCRKEFALCALETEEEIKKLEGEKK